MVTEPLSDEEFINRNNFINLPLFICAITRFADSLRIINLKLACQPKPPLLRQHNINVHERRLVPRAGLEPAQAKARGILSPLRLPIPPSRQFEWSSF